MSIVVYPRIFLFKFMVCAIFASFQLAGMEKTAPFSSACTESAQAEIYSQTLEWANLARCNAITADLHDKLYEPAFKKFKSATKKLVNTLQNHNAHRTTNKFTYPVPTNYKTREDFTGCIDFIDERVGSLGFPTIAVNYTLPPILEKAHRLHIYLSKRQSCTEVKESPGFLAALDKLGQTIEEWHTQFPPQVENCTNEEVINKLVQECEPYKKMLVKKDVDEWKNVLGTANMPDDGTYKAAEESYINYACGQGCTIDRYKHGLLKARWTYSTLKQFSTTNPLCGLLGTALINYLEAFTKKQPVDRVNNFLRPFLLALAISPEPISFDDIARLNQTYLYKPQENLPALFSFAKESVTALEGNNQLYDAWSATIRKYFKNLSKDLLTQEKASKCLVQLYHFTQAMMTLAPQASAKHITIVEQFAQKNGTHDLITGMQIKEDIQGLINELMLYTQHQQWWRTCRMLVGCSSLILLAMYYVYSHHYLPAR